MTRANPLPADRVANDAQAQLQQIVDHTSAAMFVKDLDGRFLFVNREFERMKGMPVAAIVGRLDGERFPGRRRSFAATTARSWTSGGRSISRRASDRARNPHVPGAQVSASRRHRTRVRGVRRCDRHHRAQAQRRGAARGRARRDGAEGEGVFHELVRYLSAILEVDVAMIAVHVDGDRTRMRTLAVRLDGSRSSTSSTRSTVRRAATSSAASSASSAQVSSPSSRPARCSRPRAWTAMRRCRSTTRAGSRSG